MTVTAQAMWVLGGARLFLPSSDLVPGTSGVLELPIALFLVEHGDDLVLVDTGLSADAADNEDAIYGSVRPDLIVKMTREQTVGAQLASIGRTPADVTHIVISHGHFDHAGGLPLFPDATVVMHSREWEYVTAQPKGRAVPVRDLDWAGVTESRLDLFEGDYDLFGDGAITILEMPGHSPGNCSVMVALPSRTLLLSLDTVHVRIGYEPEAVSHIDSEPDDARASIQRIKQLEASTDATLWITHDIDDWNAFGPAGRRLT